MECLAAIRCFHHSNKGICNLQALALDMQASHQIQARFFPVQDMLNAAPAPAFSTTPVGNRRLLQDSNSGVQVQTQITSPAGSVNAISTAIRNSIASGTLAEALGRFAEAEEARDLSGHDLLHQKACF